MQYCHTHLGLFNSQLTFISLSLILMGLEMSLNLRIILSWHNWASNLRDITWLQGQITQEPELKNYLSLVTSEALVLSMSMKIQLDIVNNIYYYYLLTFVNYFTLVWLKHKHIFFIYVCITAEILKINILIWLCSFILLL